MPKLLLHLSVSMVSPILIEKKKATFLWTKNGFSKPSIAFYTTVVTGDLAPTVSE